MKLILFLVLVVIVLVQVNIGTLSPKLIKLINVIVFTQTAFATYNFGRNNGNIVSFDGGRDNVYGDNYGMNILYGGSGNNGAGIYNSPGSGNLYFSNYNGGGNSETNGYSVFNNIGSGSHFIFSQPTRRAYRRW